MKQRTGCSYWGLVIAAVLGAQWFAVPSLADAPPAAPRTVVLKAAHLFDSVSGKLIEHGVVVVSGTKIQAVGSDAKIPAGAQVIDLGDATLLPGFIDAHVHLSEQSSPDWYHDWFDSIMRFPAEQALYGAHYAKVTLEAGVTTVRDLGSSDYISLGLRNAINAGADSGPAHAGGQLCDRSDRRPCRSGSGAAAAHRGGRAHSGRVQRRG